MIRTRETVEPARLAEAIEHRVAQSNSDVSAYWYKVVGDRDNYAKLLRARLRNSPVVTLIVRDVRFDNPNSVLADLIEVIRRNRAAFESMASEQAGRISKCGLVLLARTELSVAQASSPVILPEWFPLGGGTSASILIEDLTWTAEAPVNCQESRVEEVCERLFDLEGSILRRLISVHGDDPSAGDALLSVIRRKEDEKLSDILLSAEAHRSKVTTPSAFRPSRREGASLVARLWDIAQLTHPDGLGRPSKALAKALSLPTALDLPWYESLASVLRRPSGRELRPDHRFARNLLVTVATACQLITAAAHSGEYGHYPVALLRSISFELRRSMDEAETLLEGLDR